MTREGREEEGEGKVGVEGEEVSEEGGDAGHK